jgi:hypothetical protein
MINDFPNSEQSLLSWLHVHALMSSEFHTEHLKNGNVVILLIKFMYCFFCI